MKIELKNIKHSEELSDDSNAFSANLYVNGKFIATCTDNGDGGGINIKANKGCEAILREAGVYAMTLPKNEEFDLDMDLELFIGQLVDAYIEEKEFKKSVKSLEVNNIVFGNRNKELYSTWFTAGGKKKVPIATMLSTPSTKEKLAKRITDLKNKGNQIFNTNIPNEVLNMDNDKDNKESE